MSGRRGKRLYVCSLRVQVDTGIFINTYSYVRAGCVKYNSAGAVSFLRQRSRPPCLCLRRRQHNKGGVIWIDGGGVRR